MYHAGKEIWWLVELEARHCWQMPALGCDKNGEPSWYRKGASLYPSAPAILWFICIQSNHDIITLEPSNYYSFLWSTFDESCQHVDIHSYIHVYIFGVGSNILWSHHKLSSCSPNQLCYSERHVSVASGQCGFQVSQHLSKNALQTHLVMDLGWNCGLNMWGRIMTGQLTKNVP